MFIATASAESVRNVLQSSSAISDYFTTQFQNLTPLNVIIALLMGFAVGCIVAFTYKMCYRGVLYSPSFALTLIMLTLITTPVVMCIKSNISLSMGMVGALSIVRFRTAVKDPLDTAYMFWALTMGILLGADLHFIAIAVALGIAVILFLLTFVKFTVAKSYLLVVHYDGQYEASITNAIIKMVKKHRMRSKTVTRSSTEMTMEVILDDRQDVVSSLLDEEGVYDATLVSCQSEAGA